MNTAGRLSASAVIGLRVGGISVYSFMEGQVERRVSYEASVTALAARMTELDSSFRERLVRVESSFRERLSAVESSFRERLSAIEADLDATTEKTEARLEEQKGKLWTLEQMQLRHREDFVVYRAQHP